MSEIMDTYKEKKAKENVNIPLVNAEALNRIMVESDDEDDEGNKFFLSDTNKVFKILCICSYVSIVKHLLTF